MISSKNLADAIYEISLQSKQDNGVLIAVILDYIKEYKLESLLPEIIIYLEDKLNKKLKWNTLAIKSGIEISEEIKQKIKSRLDANDAENITSTLDKNLIGGFTATYKGVIYDASIKNQLELLRNALTK